MNHRDPLDCVLKLYELMCGAPATGATAATLAGILESHGLRHDAPGWFGDLLCTLAGDGSFAERLVDWDEFFDERKRFDISNYLAALAQTLDIRRFDDGEYFVLSFDPLHISLCVDFEMGAGVGVRLMRWPALDGPYLKRWPPEDPRSSVG